MAEGRRPDGQPTCGVWPKASLLCGTQVTRVRIDGGAVQSFISQGPTVINILFCKKEKEKKGFCLLDEICITVGPWLMKLCITPPSILTLVTWVPQSKLAFGQTSNVGWPSGLRVVLQRCCNKYV